MSLGKFVWANHHEHKNVRPPWLPCL